MLKWAVVFTLIAAIVGGSGFAGVAGAVIGVAKFLFFAALALAMTLSALVLRRVGEDRGQDRPGFKIKEDRRVLIQTNVANSLEVHNGLTAEWEASVRSRLARYEDRLTRIEIHVGDVNPDRGGPHDKRCTLEARPNGLAPVSVTHDAATTDQAVAGAAGKLLVTLERTFGKLTDRKGH